MNPRPDPKYASAEGPVNRRTAAWRDRLAERASANPRVQQHLLNAQARHVLGAPLGQQLEQQSSHRSTARRMGAHHAVLSLAAIAGLVGAWMAWRQAGATGLAAGSTLLLCSAAAAVWGLRARRRAQPPSDATPAGPVFDPKALAQLDQVLELLAPQVPADTLVRLAGLKSTLVRMAPLLVKVQVDEYFTMDDRLYIAEFVRRYLPDTLQGWLQVPAHLRATPGQGGSPSAQALLDQQLALLQGQLAQRELKLGHGAAERLRRQQRFLRAKNGDVD